MAVKKMARRKKAKNKRPIESYEHRDKKRVNIPPVGLVTPDTDPDVRQKKNLRLRPAPRPAAPGRARPSTPVRGAHGLLHVHERIDPRTIIEAVREAQRQRSRAADGALRRPRRTAAARGYRVLPAQSTAGRTA